MKKNKYLLLVILLSLIPLFSLLKPGMYWAHDTESHIVRIASFYQSLTEGNVFPRWSQSLNAGYGHPIFMFLYPLPSYLASLFLFLKFSVYSSIKLVLATSYIASGAWMYLWLKKHFQKHAALVATFVWQLAPYRFVNLYVRNALGEHVSFAFVPLVLLTLFNLIKKPNHKNLIISALATAGLLLAHNAVSLMFLPFIFIYAAILINKSTNKILNAKHYLLATILGFCISAFFWIPAFFEGKYTLREIVMRGDTFAVHFPSLKQLIMPTWGYDNSIQGSKDDLSFQIGIVQWVSFISALILLVTKKIKQNKSLALLSLAGFIASTFILLDVSLPVWKLVTIIKKFQFPWRFLIVPVFASSILSASVVEHFKSKYLVIITIVLAFLLNASYFKPRGDYFPPEQQVISSYLGTSDTGESVPRWAIRFQEKRADDTLGVVFGAPIDYKIIKRESEIHEHTITATVDTQVSENTLYFPGWKVFIDDQQVPITFEDQNWRGVITYLVPEGTHRVKVVFTETKLRTAANILTLLSLGTVAFLLVYPYVKKD